MIKTSGMTVTEQRLRIVGREYGMKSKSEMARFIGISSSVLNNWCYRDNIPNNMLQLMLEKFPGLSEDFMRNGIEPVILPCQCPSAIPHSLGRYPIDLVTAEQINQERATMMAEDFVVTCGDVDLGQVSEQLVPIHLPGGCAKYMFGCRGVSMEPRLHEGDYIGVNETMTKYEKFDPERMYLVFTKTGKAMVKYVEDPGPEYDYLQLRTLNEDYKLDDDGRLPKEEFRAACKIVVIVNWL